MTYAVQADMVERFGSEEIEQLTDREQPPLGAIDAAVLARALADADAVIDRHLAARYAVPFTGSLPRDLLRIACDLARYFLHDLAAPEIVRKNHDDALALLRRIESGQTALVDSTGALVPVKTATFGGPVCAAYPASATFGAAFAAAWQP